MKPRLSTIILSFVIALMLLLLPLPEWAETSRPDWIALVLIYWCMSNPTTIGIGAAFMIGIIIDIALGSLLGQHALAYVTIAFLVVKQHQRLRVYPALQQAMIVFILLFIQQMEILWIKGIAGLAPQSLWTYFSASFTGMLLWPWTFAILRNVRRQYSRI